MNIPASSRTTPEVVRTFTNSPLIRKLTFTGSTRIGKLLMSQAAENVQRLSLELGGNAPFIIFDDAVATDDGLTHTITQLFLSKFRNAGQTCVAANRIFIQRSSMDRVLAAIRARLSTLKVGNGFDAGVNTGPLINQNSVNKIESLITNACENGAQVLRGGSRHSAGPLFFEPTLVANCTDRMDCFRTETFGPVIFAFAFDSEDDVVRMANDTQVGLAAYTCTSVWFVTLILLSLQERFESCLETFRSSRIWHDRLQPGYRLTCSSTIRWCQTKRFWS